MISSLLEADRIFLNALYNTARLIRPGEAPQTLMAVRPDMLHASWLAFQLQIGGFGKNIEVKQCVTYTSAKNLDDLVENMMLAKGMFFVGYSEEELERAKPILRKELEKLRTFEEADGGVRIGMKAWIGVGWKRGDESEVPV